MKLVIKNAHILNPENKLDIMGSLYIDDGRIVKIITSGEEGSLDIEKVFLEDKSTVREIDANGMVAAPGLIDVHVHFREPGFTYKEDIRTGSMASVKGGYTSVVMMANTKPVNDNEETYKAIEKLIDTVNKEIPLNIYQSQAVTMGLKGEKLTDMEALKALGTKGFTDDGIPITDEKLLRNAFIKAAELKVPVSLHEEDPKFIINNGINRGKISEELGIGGSDRMAEISLVKRDIELAKETGVELNIQHISAKESVELVREARKTHKNIHAEATPHHFSLTEEAVLKHGTLAKMNPPLREEADRQAIIEALRDGTIEIIATDHAPHSIEEKEKKITEAPSGIIGLETALALGITNLVKEGYIDIMTLIKRMTVGPANLYSLEEGIIKEGAKADIVIFDPDEEWVVDSFVSKSCNSPFKGSKLYGKVHYTICGGEIAYEG